MATTDNLVVPITVILTITTVATLVGTSLVRLPTVSTRPAGKFHSPSPESGPRLREHILPAVLIPSFLVIAVLAYMLLRRFRKRKREREAREKPLPFTESDSSFHSTGTATTGGIGLTAIKGSGKRCSQRDTSFGPSARNTDTGNWEQPERVPAGLEPSADASGEHERLPVTRAEMLALQARLADIETQQSPQLPPDYSSISSR